jgi:parallel beta-helix repeat protein
MRKLNALIITLILFITTLNVIAISDKASTPNKILYVDDDNTQGPWDGTINHPYQYIQDAIDNADEDYKIHIFNGTYYENIISNKTLIIEGENPKNTIIDGQYADVVIDIIDKHVKITNLSIRNSGGFKDNAGIKIHTNDNLIINCIIYRTKTGIYFDGANFSEINKCTFYSNGEGIFLNSIYSCNIIDCCFTHNAFGININNSKNIKIEGSYAHTCGIGYFIINSEDIQFLKSAAYNNNDNQGGIFMYFSKKIKIADCNVKHNGLSITIRGCHNVEISDSDLFWNTHYAVYIGSDSTFITIKNCNIFENFRNGIQVYNSSCILQNNNIYSHVFGIWAERSYINARGNWWGSPLGPTFIERKVRDRFFMKFGRLKVFPWRVLKIRNTGASWDIDEDFCDVNFNSSRFQEIQIPGLDFDNDLIPDWWEFKWGYDPFIWDDHKNLDPDEDALNNIEECYADEWGSNPFKKDLFIECDWVESVYSGITNKPQQEYIDNMTEKFEEHNITLHFDIGLLGGGEEIPVINNFTYPDLRDLYWDYFLHNDINNPRKGIFHYSLVCDLGPSRGFSFIGLDHLDSFCTSAQMIQGSYPTRPRAEVIQRIIFHELGHTLGLTVDDHGGNDNEAVTLPFMVQYLKYRNYKSIMNYHYTYKLFDYSDGTNGKGDFDDWSNLDLSFFKNTHFIVTSPQLA